MPGLIDVISNYIKPYYFRFLTVTILLIFIVVGYYAYNIFYVKSQSKFSNIANNNDREEDAIIYLFHVDWCPHCKKAMPEWNKFSAKYEGKQINGYTIKCIDMDCTNESPDIISAINKYSIESYPTIKMIKDGKTIEFDSKITETSLESFVNTML